MKKIYTTMLLLAACSTMPVMAQDEDEPLTGDSVATFESIDLSDRGYNNGDDGFGGFFDGAFIFYNNYNEQYGSWSGFAISNKKETDFVDYNTSQYNSCVGHGVNNSDSYAVYYYSNYGTTSPMDVESIQDFNGNDFNALGFYVTNSAWNVNAYLKGDGMTEGGFKTGDWCKLTVYGVKDDAIQGSVDFYLADYRSSNEADHYYVNDWKWLDLTSLGTVSQLNFAITSSRNNAWGMTTPAYFCMDNFNDPAAATTGITTVKSDTTGKLHEVARYNLNGEKLESPQKGINLIKMSDGTTRKILVK
ncbi:MAG: DUF4465 domain-containing protein [Prevotella sp.]|nr:DUF4465 domain-containing protein [Prevotella sp.]